MMGSGAKKGPGTRLHLSRVNLSRLDLSRLNLPRLNSIQARSIQAQFYPGSDPGKLFECHGSAGICEHKYNY